MLHGKQAWRLQPTSSKVIIPSRFICKYSPANQSSIIDAVKTSVFSSIFANAQYSICTTRTDPGTTRPTLTVTAKSTRVSAVTASLFSTRSAMTGYYAMSGCHMRSPRLSAASWSQRSTAVAGRLSNEPKQKKRDFFLRLLVCMCLDFLLLNF